MGKSTISNEQSPFLMGKSTLVGGLEQFLFFYILGINHPISDDLYHPFIEILGIVYYCLNHIINGGYNDDNVAPAIV